MNKDPEQLCGFYRPPKSYIYWDVLCWLFLSIILITFYHKKLKKKFGGTPLSAPLKLKPPKKDPPWLPITPSFQSRILFYNKNRGVCNKLELNILKIDQAIAILSSKKVFQKNLDFRKYFVLLGKIVISLSISSRWSLMSPFNCSSV